MEDNKKIILLIVIVLIVVGVGGWLLYQYVLSGEGINIGNTNKNSNGTLTNSQPIGNTNTIREYPSVIVEENYLKVTMLDDLSQEDKNILMLTENYLYLDKMNRICNRDGEEQKKNDCLGSLLSYQVGLIDKPELCQQLSGQYKDNCYNNMAAKRLDLSLCQNIDDQTKKTECSDSINLSKAMDNNDPNSCLGISDEDEKNRCMEVVFFSQSELSFCSNSVVVDNGFQDLCQSMVLTNQAFINADISICDQVPLEDYKQSCKDQYGEYNQ